MRRHKLALSCVKDFWRVLLFSDIRFSALVKAFGKVERAQVQAHKTYQMVLERYPSSVKLLRSYALFTEEVTKALFNRCLQCNLCRAGKLAAETSWLTQYCLSALVLQCFPTEST
jgi:hypothetical protein